jgi:hypothetical protein
VPVFAEGPVELQRAGRDAETWRIPHPAHVQEPLIASVVAALRGVGRCPSTGASAWRTSIVMDAALDVYYGGRDDGVWNRPWPRR